MFNDIKFTKIKVNFYSLKVFKCLLICFLFSFFLSLNKIFLATLLFFFLIFLKIKKINIILINLILICLFLKLLFLIFPVNDPYLNTIHEKDFLYGRKNFQYIYNSYGGDLSNNKVNLKKKIIIKNDNLGFRNNKNFLDQKYIFVGDSFLHNLKISQENLIQNILKNKYNIDIYNASLSSHDISHYFEVIKFFKKKNKFSKYVMFIFPGNDLLNYNDPKLNYGTLNHNFLLEKYMDLKKIFNFHSLISYYRYSFKKNSPKSRVVEFKNQSLKLFFYKDYLQINKSEVLFSKNFNIYKSSLPDLIIILPAKSHIYCNFFKELPCVKNNFVEKLKANLIFKDIEIIDSTNFLKNKAYQLFKENKQTIYDYDDTHLNEIGLIYLGEFINNNLDIINN